MIQKVPLRGYRNIFSPMLPSHDESSMSTLLTSILLIRYMFQYALQMQRSTKRMCQSEKKFWYSDGTHFLLLTFSVHFVVQKRMLILNATSLFFYRVIWIDFTFFFFQCTMSTFYKNRQRFIKSLTNSYVIFRSFYF